MADKDFGVKRINLVGASGTPTITSPTDLIINANKVAISTNFTVGGSIGVGTADPKTKLWVDGNGYFTGIVTATTFSGTATYATNAGIATYATSAGIATYATNAGVSTYATSAGIATYATNAGIATYATNAGIATYATNAGVSTYATNAGISTYATSAGIATYATNAGIATYATNAGIATYATNAGVSTYATNAGVSTYATNAGIATYATNAGVSTYATNAGVSTYATNAGIATYATDAGISTYATNAGVSTYATNAGIATYATNAGIATYATDAGISTYATNAGVSTYATNAGIATYATNAGIATYATNAGVSTYATNAGIATYATNAGVSTYATNAGIATALQTPRTFEITGDIVGAAVTFDGTGNVSIAATIQPNSVALGSDTTGDYVQSISGTSNQITVTGGTGEGSAPTLSIPNQFTVPEDLTVLRDVQIDRNLNVNGNITIGGTSAYILAESFRVSDADIILGFRTDPSTGNDASNDTTANHGGIAVASTEGNPLVNLTIAGIETLPPTYKKIMWFKAGEFAGLGTDAWLFNYAVGIGSTQFPWGTRLAAGAVQFTENDLAVIRNINSSGVITATKFVGSVGFATTAINLAGGSQGSLPYQTQSGITSFLSSGGNNQVLLYDIGNNKPYWGDVSSGSGSFGGIVVRDEGTSSYSNITTVDIFGSNITATSGGSGIASIRVSDTLVGTSLSISGISTLGTVSISSGIISSTTGTAVTFIGNLDGTATNLKGGLAGNIPYQSTADTTVFLVNGSSGTILQSNGIGNAPTWVSAAPADAITGLTVRDEGNIVGGANGVSQLNFVGNIVSVASTLGIATITFLDYVSNAGVSTYATNAGIATYATNAGVSTYATSAGIATYATNAGIATYATNAGVSTYATNAGIATYATNAGVSTYATNAGIATYATNAGVSTYATSSGIATYATNAGIATYATNAGVSTYATSSGIATYATNAGIATYATNAGIATYATNAGISTYATSAGIATYATNAGIATYATNAGIATNLKGGVVGNVPYQSASDTTNFVTNGSPGQILISNGDATPYWGNVSSASGSFGGITVRDESNLVGTANSIVTLNFVGSNIQATATTGSSGIATITISDNLVGTALSISGISTLGTVKISSGIVTASSGIVTYYGDGSKLSNIISAVSISTNTTNQSQYLTYVTETGSTSGFGVTTTGLVFNPSSNSLGIGTTNPTSKLTVQGNVLISGVTTSGILRISSSTVSPNDSRPVATLEAVGSGSDYDIAIVPKGDGAIVANIPDGTATGGNKRGSRANDFQRSRSSATQVASGTYSVIGGGTNNTTGGTGAVVCGGETNSTGLFSFSAIVGGQNNINNGGGYSFIGGGYNNTSQTDYVVIGGGNVNTASGQYSSVLGGSNNKAESTYSSVLGGYYNYAKKNYSSVIGGYGANTRNTYGAVAFAGANTSFGTGIGGGYQQARFAILSKATTDATPSTLTANGGSYDGDNVFDIPAATAYLVKGSVIAYAVFAGTGNARAWEFTTVIKRQYSSPSIVGTPIISDIAYDSGASGWNLSITADASTNSLKVEVTGQASTSIRWVTKIDSTEVAF